MTGRFSLARSPQDGVAPHGLPTSPCLDLVITENDFIKCEEVVGTDESRIRTKPTDYSRHLDELNKKTDVILSKCVQSLLLSDKLQQGVTLLELWESFSLLQGKETKTISEEIQLFILKLDKLGAVWDYVQELGLDADDSLEKLRGKAAILRGCVKDDRSLNAGGKFEWVDSVLIKCLQNGYWLLVDNVNLCSSAVLDRLNALLEPHGVLTIGERGVDKDGRMMIIKPHEDFRLFLTMDPKNGEISRAMRNRGVEIYILNDAESSTKNDFDLKSMIQMNNLNNKKHIRVLLHMHEFLTDLILGEKPTVNELLQAALLISQQIRYGIEEIQAFSSSLIEVYYKTRSAIEFNTNDINEVVSTKLKTLLSTSHLMDDHVEIDWHNEHFTIKTNHLEISSEIENFKQQSALMHSILKNDVEVEHENILEYLLVMFYSLATRQDLKRRHGYMKYSLVDNKDMNLLNLVNQIFEELLEHGTFSIDDLPMDHRWLPDTVYALQDNSGVNRTILKLFLMVYYYNERKLMDVNKSQVTLLDYMKSRKMRKVEDKFNDIILNNFIDLIQFYDTSLNEILHESSLNLTNEDVVNVLFLIKWRFAFFRCSLVDIKNKLEHNRLLTNIKVHYNWFLKYAVRDVTKSLNQVMSEDFNSILVGINQIMDKQSCGLFKIGSNYQKFSNKPPPFTEMSNLDIMSDYERISCFYNVCDRRNNFKTVLQLSTDSNIRNILIDIKIDLTFNFDDIYEKINVLKMTHSKNETLIPKELSRYNLELIPFQDHLEQLEVRKIFSMNIKDSGSMRNSVMIPTDLIATYLKYATAKDARLSHELMKTYFLYLNDSPSVHTKVYLDRDVADSQVLLSGHHPKLSYYLTNLLSSEHNGMNVSKLGNFRDLMEQHRTLNMTLWKNVESLHSAEYNFIVVESAYIKNDGDTFIEQLASSLKIHKTTSNFSELVEKCTRAIDGFKTSISSDDHRDMIVKFTEILKNCYENLNHLVNIETGMVQEKIHMVSCIHTQLAYLKLLLNTQLHLIDPLTKKSIKKEYCEQAILDFERLAMCFELQNKVYSASPSTVHELYKPLKDQVDRLMEKTRSLGEYVAVRSENMDYESVLKDVSHGMSSILSMKSFSQIEEANAVIENLASAIKNKNVSYCAKQAENILSQHESSVPSYENLLLNWSKYRISYPDIVEPLLCNVAQFLYGYKMKISLLNKLILQFKFLRQNIRIDETMTNLVKYPVIDENQEDYMKQIEIYTGENVQKLISGVLKSVEAPHLVDMENFRLLKCGIMEAFNACIIDGNSAEILNRTIYTQFMELVKKFVEAYNTQQSMKEEQEKEAESLYKTKTKCQDLSEDQQIDEELKELFPNFHTIDFSDMQTFVQMSDEPEPENVEQEYSVQISYEDLKFVSELHVALVENFTKTEWLSPQKNKNVICNFIQPLLQKFKVFKHLMDKAVTSLDFTMDEELFGSLNVLLGVVQRYGNEDLVDDMVTSPTSLLRNEYHDFYKDADVEEVKSCFHILEELKVRIEQLLDEWPEQPTLKTIVLIIDRIYNFDITSPVSRFLTGFEILLSKCHEWEQVAHSGVSLSQYEQTLTQQIISWRKKELTMWKNLLNATFVRLNDSKAKWWLYLFRITEQFIVEKLFSVEELITTLQTFITNSNIAEFQSRLDLLFAFHCYAVHFDSSQHSQAHVYHSVLWNLYQYYNQFRASVTNKIKDLRAPIEKKLKDYVKIVKWKDISYWSVKETVDKTHKILHKHVREFKDVMNQPVLKYLVHTNTSNNREENVGIWDRPQRHSPKKYHYTMDSSNYMAKMPTFTKLEHGTESGIGKECEVLSKIDSYFSKARRLCKDIVDATNYPNLVRDLDEFVGEIIETSSHLQNLEVDTTLPKTKQKSQAKSILQQKHRALADLFKTLSKIGLSFRTGIVDHTVKKNTEDFTIKPVDLKASSNHIGSSRNDEKILTIWDSCELYFLRSLIRFNTLESALLQPAKDLGLNNIQRCQGYSAHLLTLSHKQKIEMIEMSRCLYHLRYYFGDMSRYCNSTDYVKIESLDNLKRIMENLIIVSSQYKIILNTCPVEDSVNMNPVKIIQLSGHKKDFIKYKYDDVWTKIYEAFNSLVALANKILTLIRKSIALVPSSYNLILPKLIPMEDRDIISSQLNLIFYQTEDILSIIGETRLARSLKWLQSRILKAKEELNMPIFPDIGMNTKDLQENIEKSSSKMLLVIQEVYRKYSKISNEATQITDAEEPQTELKEDHLKNLLVENLLSDIVDLNFRKIVKSVSKVNDCLHSLRLPLDEATKQMINQYLSLTDQMILLYQYFLTQQVSAYRVTCKLNSVLLNIFIELAGKGFCVPPEFADEMDEEGVSKPTDGMGLGDGKGEKDVSDKIESEDQLDDTQVEGQEKEKQEDSDCKEEEKGIEMSEDFDSKLQDKEKKEDENEDNDDDSDSDAEEQMGETGKGADKLDEEIWGSDKEDDEQGSEEEADKEEESGNKGEDEQDQHIGAKDKDSKNQPTGEDKEEPGEENEKNKKDINEMEEPEYDEEQVDPYHGNLPEPPEPEPMDLPDDLKLDDGEEKDEEQDEENPFDIDTMKEQNIPEEKDVNADEEVKEDKQKDEVEEYSSDDEEVKKADNDDSQKGEEDNEDNQSEEKKEEDQVGETDAEEKDVPEEVKNDSHEDDVEKSGLDQNQTSEDHVEAMEVDDTEAADKTQGTESENKSSQPIDELQQEDKPDQDGMGQSQMEENRSGHSSQTDKPQEMDITKKDADEDLKRKQKPGESDSQRSLGDVNEPVQKKLKTMDTKDDKEDEAVQEPEEDEKAKAEMYKHIKDAKEDATQVLDVATKEQAEAQKEQTVPGEEEEEAEDPTESSKDLPNEEEEELDVADNVKQKPERLENQKDKKKDKMSHPDGEVLEEMESMEIEGEIVETATVSRGAESSHHTLFEDRKIIVDSTLSIEEMNSLRSEVEQQMSSWYEPPSDMEAEQTWQKISSVTSTLAQELSEQLRLVLEPTQASRLKGDYRTGRRINMRKVIPYIASQFRKDKIWLRRTKPSKREYQIVLAIDDSSSMADNKSKEMAFESVALISKALTLLESGQLSIVSFGEQTEVLHKLTDQFTEKSGVKLLQKFKFAQTKTCLAKLVDFTTEMLGQSQFHSAGLNAKLLIIVSDGRGVFSEGEAVMRQAVRRGKLANIFTVFVIIDNPENKNSVLDIRMPVFKDGKLLGINNYMDVFPFSFYILLRDLVSLPNVLSDALRQWFEIVSNLDKQ